MKLVPRRAAAEDGKVYIRADPLYFGIGIGYDYGGIRYIELDPSTNHAMGGEVATVGNFTLELSDHEKKELFTILNKFFLDIKESL